MGVVGTGDRGDLDAGPRRGCGGGCCCLLGDAVRRRAAQELGLPIHVHLAGGLHGIKMKLGSWRMPASVAVVPMQLDETLAGMIFSCILEKRPRDQQALLAAARLATKKGQTDEAERLLRAALDLAPESPRAFQLLAHLLLEQGKTLEARQIVDNHVERLQSRGAHKG